MTLDETKKAVETLLSDKLLAPEVSVDVFAYNSKVYYIITDGGGNGEGVYRMPITGNETVLDALSQIYGLPAVASKRRIWVARPSPEGPQGDKILPVDWVAMTRDGRATANYQVLPGDRIYVQAQPIVTVDTYLTRALAPFEKLFGITLLGSSVIRNVNSVNTPSSGL